MQALARSSFTPSLYAVLTISAPQWLLSASLISLLVAFGTYLGFVWTHKLDKNVDPNDSRNVFVTYLTALGASFFAYSLSNLRGILDSTSDFREEHILVLRAAETWIRCNRHEVNLDSTRQEADEENGLHLST